MSEKSLSKIISDAFNESYELANELKTLGVLLEVDVVDSYHEIVRRWLEDGHCNVVGDISRIIQGKAIELMGAIEKAEGLVGAEICKMQEMGP